MAAYHILRKSRLPPDITQNAPLDDSIDPALFSPSKRVRIMTASLAKTASGSCFVSKALVTSSSLITKPVLKGPPDIPISKWSLVAPTASVSKMLHNDLKLYASKPRDSLMLAKQHVQGRDTIIEGAHAQLVIQDVFTIKQG
ncbi:hypothetical protein SERLA73DRAFT_68316 [Serpula lacrymans var. lacrymans S7.3]|uniref:Uncharacterized protein n=2 Tax=Serpula lacrymans var. lacrymans TaxID=341189 RepID=F8PI54_SERL3|nr:uncharacterized protein SERLADRAFT_432059 [Serpula lacrymans var. lacrymans S7.9]EGO04632.1 hypothetical protein SERLA73DRAFT_68316 [Serpula lacrymans var. lacrymans S7.3]EGO30492.1 hypothetical protein SERLADRAFT_432059 [Serpula lacrymans var. lacrymans S7.9]